MNIFCMRTGLCSAGGELINASPLTERLFGEAVDSGMEVYRKKGHTNYAVAMATSMIVESIVHNEHRTMPLSIAIEGVYGVSYVCLSLPVVVGAHGIERILHPTLSVDEEQLFKESAATVHAAIVASRDRD